MPKTSSKAPRKKAEKAQKRKSGAAPRKLAAAAATVKDLLRKSKPVAPPAGAGARRAVFIDVENTSSEAALLGALDQLEIDRSAGPTEVVAVGNWRVIGQHVARTLAQRGARLLHTAPAAGVKDWSDLSIAVASGIWLGRAQPGDQIEIISADRAFDAVADAAANLGVRFRRLTYGPTSGLAESITPVANDGGGERRRRRRGGRSRRRGSGLESYAAWAEAASKTSPARTPAGPATANAVSTAARRPEPAHVEPATESTNGADRDVQGANHEQIIATIARLTTKAPERGVNLDLLINALKAEGFGRPSGSPRLVTRLRKMKDVEVSPTGMVRLLGPLAARVPEIEAAPPAARAGDIVRAETEGPEAEAVSGNASASAEAKLSAKRPRRRGGSGRGQRRPSAKAAVAKEPPVAEGV